MFRFIYHGWRVVAFGFILFLITVAVLSSGCSGSSNPVDPSAQLDISDRIPDSSDSSRMLLGYFNLIFNEDRTSCEVKPVRDATFHLNVLHFTEYFNPGGVKVEDFYLHPDGSLTIALLFTHPLGMDEYTIFDVRGIMMLPAEYFWPATLVNTPGVFPGQSALLNADGYTRRWNPYEFMDFPVPFSYFDSPLTKDMGIDVQTLVNPYIQYWTNTDRMYFQAGLWQTIHYHISLDPAQSIVGLAFDCSWQEMNPPGAGGVKIPGDFPPDANSLEPYAISVAGQEGNLECSVGLWAGGVANVHINVKDWQNEAYVPFDKVRLEIPELYEGFLNPWTGEGTEQDFTYQFSVLNDKFFEPTTLVGLFSIECPEEDQYFVPDIPLTAYQLITLNVVEVDPPLCDGNSAMHRDYGGTFNMNNSYGNLHLDSSFLPVTIAGEGGLLFDGGKTGGNEHIQAALIAPYGGNTTANTIITRSGYSAGNALVAQTNDFNGHILIVSDSDPDNLLIFSGTGQLLKEYDLGGGDYTYNEPVCLTTDPDNGDIWMVGDKGSMGIHLERLIYLEQSGSFEYEFDPASKLDLTPWLGSVDPKPLGIGINGHYNCLYLFHADDMGSIEKFDISMMPPVHDDKWSRSEIFDQEITPTHVAGIRKLVGGDLVIDHADGEIDAQCRILVFANTADGSSRLAKLDVWCQTLNYTNLGSPYSCMALNNYSTPSDRCLVLFPNVMVNEFVIFEAPPDW
jgi:hypothetical protein